MIGKIISGGQTGADRGALRAALKARFKAVSGNSLTPGKITYYFDSNN